MQEEQAGRVALAEDVEDVDAVDPPEQASVSRRDRIRHGVVLVLATGLFGGGLVYVAPDVGAVVGAAFGPDPQPTPTCRSVVRPAPSPSSFPVNVYNASDQPGWASSVARQLEQRDFRVKAVANDPVLAVVNGPAQIRFGSKGQAQAQVVARQVAGAQLVNDYRRDTSVDFVVGVGFQQLAPAPPTPPPAAGSFVVNVYNTTFRTGLAGEVARQLGRRGFRPGKTANDPLKSMIAGVGELRFGDRGERQAQTVARHLPGLSTRRDDRAGTSVDLVLGNGYASLLPTHQLPPLPDPKSFPTPTVTLSDC